MLGGFALVIVAANQAPAKAVETVFSAPLEEVRFSNGMRAVVVRTPVVPGREARVFVGLYLRYGQATAKRLELAHLVEHVSANNRPTLVNYQVPANLATFGGNAMTRTDYMSFWRTVDPKGLEAMIPSRANRVVGVANDSAVFTREVGRVAAETERAIDRIGREGLTPDDALPAAMFGPRPTLAALLDSIRGFDSTTVYREIRNHFRPDNALLVVAGDLDVAATVEMVRRHLGAYQGRPGPRSETGPAIVTGREPVVIPDDRVVLPRVGVGFPAPPRLSRDFLAALVVEQYLLGGRAPSGDSAVTGRSIGTPLGERLARLLGVSALDDGLDYGTDPPRLAFRSPSYFSLSFTVGTRLTPDSIVAATRAALAGALAEDLSDQAIATAKEDLTRFLAHWMMFPDLLPLADHLAAFVFIDGSAKRLHSLPAEIAGLGPEQIRRVARRYFGPAAGRIVVVGK